jgi:hypothetical protein
LEIDFQRGVERELKRLILLFTHWVQASGASVAPSKPHGYWRWLDHTITYLNFKKEMWVNSLSVDPSEEGLFELGPLSICLAVDS